MDTEISPDLPSFWSAEGLKGVSIHITHLDGIKSQYITPGVPEFDTMAKALSLGVRILNTFDGRRVLAELGRAIVTGWEDELRWTFGGDVDLMPLYVDHFLERIQNDFPCVELSLAMKTGVSAETQRNPMWAQPEFGGGNLADYRPKAAVSFAFSYLKTIELSRSYQYMEPGKYARLLFQIGTTTAHELAHAFGGYLAEGSLHIGSYTPLKVYFGDLVNQDGTRGESGRWLENRLFGGALAWLRSPDETIDLFGQEYLIQGGKYWRIDPHVITDIVVHLDTKPNIFPFRCIGEGITNAGVLMQNLCMLS